MRIIQRWVHAWRDESLETRGRRRIIPYDFFEELTKVLKTEPALTLREMMKLAATDGNCSRSTMARFLNSQRISHKKISYTYCESNDDDVERFKRMMVEEKRGQPVAAVDESSFRLNYVPRYGWSTKGSRANGKRSGVRGVSYSLILCVEVNV